jgi:hypothetical protein
MPENEINRGFQGLSEVCSGYVSFQGIARKVFGTSPSRLRNEYPFFDLEHYRCESDDLMPVIDLKDMMGEYYSVVHSSGLSWHDDSVSWIFYAKKFY